MKSTLRTRELQPFPQGWYTVAFAAELKSGKIKSFTFAGEEVIAFRTESGKVSVMEAYCPHMGAHFAYGGEVKGETIKCPFHSFHFNTDGECTKTCYGTAPPARAKARTWPVTEVGGMVMAWHDPEGEAPIWEIPQVEMEGWSSLLHTQWQLRSHPQEIAENSVDVGHFVETHGYSEVETLKDLNVDGSFLNAKYGMVRPSPFLGLFGKKINTQFEIFQHGLGFAMVQVEVPMFGIRTRQFVLTSPIAGEEVHLRAAICIYAPKAKGWKRLLPTSWIKSLYLLIMRRVVFNGFKADIGMDLPIWAHKKYLNHAALAKGDGPIGRYRLWAKQFYPKKSRPAGLQPSIAQ